MKDSTQYSRLVRYFAVPMYRQEQGKCMSKVAVRVWAWCREELSFHLKLHASQPPHLAPTTTTDISPYRNNFTQLRYSVDCNMFIH
jgi:hypothetical protein